MEAGVTWTHRSGHLRLWTLLLIPLCSTWQYKKVRAITLGKLDLQNLDTQQADLVRSVWELHEGDVYDASYAKDFLKKHPHELKALNGWGAAYTQTVHDDTLVVDLMLKFQKLEQTR